MGEKRGIGNITIMGITNKAKPMKQAYLKLALSDDDDFENRKRDVISQEWPQKVFTEEFKKKALEAGCKQDLAGTPERVVERLLQYKDHVDVLNIGLPFVGNVRQMGLDTIRILKDCIVPKL